MGGRVKSEELGREWCVDGYREVDGLNRDLETGGKTTTQVEYITEIAIHVH